MTKQISNHAAAAKMIRAELKRNGIKATVRASIYAGGSSVRVSIKQDILPATKKAITAFVDAFQYGSFDGMTDSYNYDNSRDDIPQVKYTFVEVDYSDEIKAEVREYLGADGDDWNTAQRVHHVLSGFSGSAFWNAKKPRIEI